MHLLPAAEAGRPPVPDMTEREAAIAIEAYLPDNGYGSADSASSPHCNPGEARRGR